MVLLGVYAFLIPFELVLEVYLGIDTILKPYRVLALSLIGIFTIKHLPGPRIHESVRQDLVLYLIFAYGLLLSFFQMIVVPFSMGRFYNDLFQMGLYLAVFFIVKNSVLTRENLIFIFRCLLAGIILNSAYVFNNFYFLKDYSRQAGFMDNPNYLSLSILAALVFLVIKVGIRPNWRRLISWLFIPFLVVVFIISGSRGGFFIAIFLSGILFLFQPLSGRLLFIVGGLLMAIFTIFSPEEGSNETNSSTPLVLISRLEQLDLEDDPRWPLWKGAMQAAQQSNFMGLGIGQFKYRFGEFFEGETNLVIYRILAFGYHLSPHSDYFSILVTYGIIGVLLYVIYIFIHVKRLSLSILNRKNLLRNNFYKFQLLLLATIALFGLGAENFNSPIFWFLLAYSTKIIPPEPSLVTQNEQS